MCFRPGSFCFRTVSHQNICKSVCGNSNLHFITLDPSLLSHKCQHMMGKILWWKCIHWGKSLKTQFLKFFSFLRRVSIESPTASKMSQAKTISHKVFPIPHYLTTWPPDYLTIWRLFDYLVTGWSELQPCKARGSSDYPGDWLTPCLLCHQYNICTLRVFAHCTVWHKSSPITVMTDATKFAPGSLLYWRMSLPMMLEGARIFETALESLSHGCCQN